MPTIPSDYFTAFTCNGDGGGEIVSGKGLSKAGETHTNSDYTGGRKGPAGRLTLSVLRTGNLGFMGLRADAPRHQHTATRNSATGA